MGFNEELETLPQETLEALERELERLKDGGLATRSRRQRLRTQIEALKAMQLVRGSMAGVVPDDPIADGK